jgi:hypothetical protein
MTCAIGAEGAGRRSTAHLATEVLMSAAAVSDRLCALRPSTPLRHERLTFVPLVGDSVDDPPYQLFAEDCARDVAVEEVSERGSVPRLRVRNGLAERVLIVEGQEVRGLKQNRILNADILLPPGEQREVPVTCVEQGRWGGSRAAYGVGGSASASMKARRSFSVHDSLRARRGYDGDQGATWAEAEMLISSSGARSATGALSAAYVSLDAKIAPIAETLRLPPGAVGVAAFEGDTLLGLDVFDRAAAMARYWGVLRRAYLLDYLSWGSGKGGSARTDRAGEGTATEAAPACGLGPERVSEMLDALCRREWEPFDPPGEGKDWRTTDRDLSAAALVWEGRQVIHLQAFTAAWVAPAPAAPVRRPLDADVEAWLRTSEAQAAARLARPSAPCGRKVATTGPNGAPWVHGEPAARPCPRCGFTYGLVRTADGLACNHCGFRGAS